MGLFSGMNLGGVKVSGGRGQDLTPGKYELEITGVKAGTTRDDSKFFEVIHKVLTAEGPESTKVGDETNLYCLLRGDGRDIAMQNMKEIVVVMCGLDPRNVNDAELVNGEDWGEIIDDMIKSPAQYIGRKVKCSVRMVPIKKPKAGGRTQFPARTYEPHPETRKIALGE